MHLSGDATGGTAGGTGGDAQGLGVSSMPVGSSSLSDSGLNPNVFDATTYSGTCLLYTSPSPRDRQKSRMPSSA